MQGVILVRHAEPQIDIDQPASEWPLTLRGTASARNLAGALPALGAARIVASPERKAMETARVLADALGLPLAQDERFSEQGAEAGQFLTDYAEFRSLVRHHFDHPDEVVLRQESSNDAGVRFGAAVDEHRQTPGADGALVIVSHGRIMASWLASVTRADAWPIWTGFRLPDLLDVDVDGRTFRAVDFPLA